jgi:hypothetical protein
VINYDNAIAVLAGLVMIGTVVFAFWMAFFRDEGLR